MARSSSPPDAFGWKSVLIITSHILLFRPLSIISVSPNPNLRKPISSKEHPSRILQTKNDAYRNLQLATSSDPTQEVSSSILSFNVEKTGISNAPTSPLRIYFDTSSFDTVSDTSTNRQRLKSLKNEVLPAMLSTFSSILSVNPLTDPIMVNPNACYGYVDVPSDYVTDGVEDTDIVVFAKAEECNIDNALAYAFPCELDRTTYRPVVGYISFCLDNMKLDGEGNLPSDFAKTFISVATHELGHVLGLSSWLFPYFIDRERGELIKSADSFVTESVACVDGVRRDLIMPHDTVMNAGKNSKGVLHYEVVSPTVRQVVRNQFACDTLMGARLENQPTNVEACFGSHWDERLFFTEAMGAVYSEISNILSPLTLALFEDTGWYTADYTLAPISPFGHGAGCDFVEKDCIVDGTVPDYSKGFFCNEVTRVVDNSKTGSISFSGERVCDPSHTSKALCDLFIGGVNTPIKEFQYFFDSSITSAMDQTDFCPVVRLSGSSCTDTDNTSKGFYEEQIGEDSKCFNMKNKANQYIPSSICLPTACNKRDHTLKVDVNGKTVVCEYDGQIHTLPSGSGDFECPRLASICPELFCPGNCSGKGICDYSLSNPSCLCFDEDDKSDGCFGAEPPPPTEKPTKKPTQAPTKNPTYSPTAKPSPIPTDSPTITPTTAPSPRPTPSPTPIPITITPSDSPSASPSMDITVPPSSNPTVSLTNDPTQTLKAFSLMALLPSSSPSRIKSLEIPLSTESRLSFANTHSFLTAIICTIGAIVTMMALT